jgi:hypothetical protein
MSATRKYSQDELAASCKRLSPPFWLDVENTLIPITTTQELAFACHVSSAYHNSIAYNAVDDDGFAADMQQREWELNATPEPILCHDLMCATEDIRIRQGLWR